jgi:hypothetical protein
MYCGEGDRVHLGAGERGGRQALRISFLRISFTLLNASLAAERRLCKSWNLAKIKVELARKWEKLRRF